MPVRSLNSAVFKWPDRETALAAARDWASALRHADPNIQQILCVGSYARGDWGVGSDLDLIMILADTKLSPAERYLKYHPTQLPVPVDLWVYTRAEWNRLCSSGCPLSRRLRREMLNLAGDANDPGQA